MKKKELKTLAEKIAKEEYIIQTTDDMKERARSEAKIMELSSHVDSIEDVTIIDELVQDILSKKK